MWIESKLKEFLQSKWNLAQLEQIVIEEPVLALATCAKIQFALRKILNQDGPFAVGEVEQVVYETLRLAKESQETLGRCGS